MRGRIRKKLVSVWKTRTNMWGSCRIWVTYATSFGIQYHLALMLLKFREYLRMLITFEIEIVINTKLLKSLAQAALYNHAIRAI